jgi:nucleoside-diphosphate-sugar epimerase
LFAQPATFTILGAGGFIGRALVAWLASQEHVVHPVTRGSLPALLAARRPAGHVIDCVGLTGDACRHPLETIEAHIALVGRCLARMSCDSFLFLSSTRVYAHAETTDEGAVLPQNPADPSDLYSVTKLAGEAVCLADPRPTIRVARLSNVYGVGMPEQTFLGKLLREGQATGSIILRQAPDTEMDYVDIRTVARLLPAIATTGRRRVYNLASGINTAHADIAGALSDLVGWRATFAPDAPTVRYRPIDTSRLRGEFGSGTSDLLADLPLLARDGQPAMRRLAA